MRSSSVGRGLLPAAQLLAEGGWLAVAYAAVQALAGQTPRIGPVELALVAWIGMAWSRRRRWRSPDAEAIGLPLLAVLGGAIGWFLSPEVRGALIDGRLIIALGLHPAGWLAALAVVRGHAHGSREDADVVQQRLLRWAIPGLALPWLVGQAASSGAVEREFVAAAFMGTIVFTVSAFTALGLAHLESVRLKTGSDWRANRAWLTIVLGVAIAVTAVGIPAAAFLGVPGQALLVALFGPIRLLLLALLLLATPIVIAAVWVAERLPVDLSGALPFRIPSIAVEPVEPVSSAPTIVFFAIFAVLLVAELFFLALVIYLRWRERRSMMVDVEEGFEERAIVRPPAEPRAAARPRPARRRLDPDDPSQAYLAALDSLERDGRWPRAASETPAVHARRVAGSLPGSALPRLAAAYQLARYAGLRLSSREARRARGRLSRLRALLSNR